jgi:hypothetical protein
MFFGLQALFLKSLFSLLKTLNPCLSENCQNENIQSIPVPINDGSFPLFFCSMAQIFQ